MPIKSVEIVLKRALSKVKDHFEKQAKLYELFKEYVSVLNSYKIAA